MIDVLWNDILSRMKTEGFTFDVTTDDTIRDRYYTLSIPGINGDERNSGFSGSRHKITWTVSIIVQYQPVKKPTRQLDIAKDQERIILALADVLTFHDARLHAGGECVLSTLTFHCMDYIHRGTHG
jgi:hypothetical protein